MRQLLFLAICLFPAFAHAAPVDQNRGGPYGSYSSGAIKTLPNGGRPPNKTEFPPIVDWSTLRIALERTACFGTCPIYHVEIRGDGAVRYRGENFVAVSGRHQAHIPVNTVRKLYDRFVGAEFFWSFDEYRAEIFDLPTHKLTISFDGHTKAVVDYHGVAIGMPKAFAELEDAIDQAAETEKWVVGNEQTFTSLQAENWDFHAQDDEHLALLASAARAGNSGLVKNLLAAGMRADTKFACDGLAYAAGGAHAEVVDDLLKAGAKVHWDAPLTGKDGPCDALRMAAGSGIPRIVRAILAHRPDVNWRDWNGMTALMRAVSGYEDKKRWPDRDFAIVVQMLIAAGADVNLQDNRGHSAIMEVTSSADVVRALVAAGAKDINKPTQDSDNTVLMRTYNPEAAQALLEGGANPWLVNSRGQNALESVSSTYGPYSNEVAAVLKRWMDSHPKPQ